MATSDRLARFLAAVLISGSILGGCSNDSAGMAAAANDHDFVVWFAGVGDDIAADPKYNRMPIDTAAQESEFSAKLHQVYRGEISKTEFRDWAKTTYPGHSYEVDFILRRLPD